MPQLTERDLLEGIDESLLDLNTTPDHMWFSMQRKLPTY